MDKQSDLFRIIIVGEMKIDRYQESRIIDSEYSLFDRYDIL